MKSFCRICFLSTAERGNNWWFFTYPDQSGGHGSPPCWVLEKHRAICPFSTFRRGSGSAACLVLEKQQLELPCSSGSCTIDPSVSLPTNRASMGARPALVVETHRSGMGAGPVGTRMIQDLAIGTRTVPFKSLLLEENDYWSKMEN